MSSATYPVSMHAETGSTAQQRAAVVLLVGLLHVLGGWGLLQLGEVRAVLAEQAPLFVSWVAPEIPKPAEPPKQAPKPVKRREPPPVLTTHTPPPTPAPVFEAPPAPAPVPDPPPIVAAAPAPVPAPPPVLAPPTPKTISASEARFRYKAASRYPAISKRVSEHGRVVVRVLIDTNGKPAQAQIRESSGFDRLDRAALAAALASLFYPYEENGQPIPVWVQIPYDFTLE